jgi:hypothetical protein
MASDNIYPSLDGIWDISGFSLQYNTPQDDPCELNPLPISFSGVKIDQHGRFFIYNTGDRDLPKLGVLEPIFFREKPGGWKGHLVDTGYDNDRFIFNFPDVDKNNVVQAIDIVYTESGFNRAEPSQTPRVQYAYAVRHK